MQIPDFLTVDDLSAALRRPVATIRTQMSRCPTLLPPAVRLPGAKRVMWRRDDVTAWIAQHVPDQSPSAAGQSRKRGRGRPRKADQATAAGRAS